MKQIIKLTGFAKRFGRALTVAMTLLALGVITESAQASPLNLELQASPDIMSDFINVNYDSNSQLLTVRGLVGQLADNAGQGVPVVNGSFEITAIISSTGTFTSGTVTISGEVPSLGIGQSALLTGDLNSLGFGEAGGVVEFLFSTTGGVIADQFGPITGVILGQSGFAGDFTQSFGSYAVAIASIGK